MSRPIPTVINNPIICRCGWQGLRKAVPRAEFREPPCPRCGETPYRDTRTRRKIGPKRPPMRPYYPDSMEFNGNKGGSYIRVSKVYAPPKFKDAVAGMLLLEVGETCVVTVRQEISVVALAAILTHCKDTGFQHIVDQYLGQGGGQPVFKVEHDVRKEDQDV